jgi:hypothetical protein
MGELLRSPGKRRQGAWILKKLHFYGLQGISLAVRKAEHSGLFRLESTLMPK